MINLMMDWKKGETCSCSYDMLCEYSSLAIKYPQIVFDFTVTIFMIVCSTTGWLALKSAFSAHVFSVRCCTKLILTL